MLKSVGEYLLVKSGKRTLNGSLRLRETAPKKEKLRMRGSEFTREGVVAAHWIEKFAGCPGQSRATAIGQAGTTSTVQTNLGRCASVQRDLGLHCRYKAQII